VRRISDDDEVDLRDPHPAIKRDKSGVTVSLNLGVSAVSDAANRGFHRAEIAIILAHDRESLLSSSA
jgi:hypothetical protein